MVGEALQTKTTGRPLQDGTPALPAGRLAESCLVDPVPVTPFEVVHETGLLRLRRYAPLPGPRRAPPVLLVYSLVKRPDILDLTEQRSVVRNLLGQGLAVYLVDWLPPGRADSDRGLAAYIDHDLAAAVEHVRVREDVARLTLIGPCFGGLLAVIYAALYPETVGHLVPLAVPLRMRPMIFPGAIEYMARAYGNVPAWFIRATLNASVPSRANLSDYLAQDLADADVRGEPTPALDVQAAVQHWLNSDVPMAGRVFCEILRDAYQEAQLADGRLYVGKQRVALERIECPVLNVTGERDPLTPPWTSTGLIAATGSREASNLVFPAGHLGLMVSGAAHRQLWPRIGAWLRGGAADQVAAD